MTTTEPDALRKHWALLNEMREIIEGVRAGDAVSWDKIEAHFDALHESITQLIKDKNERRLTAKEIREGDRVVARGREIAAEGVKVFEEAQQ